MSAPPTFNFAGYAAYAAALERRVASLESKLAATSARSPTHYSQADGHRPAWLPTRVLFLRAWRELREEGDAGAIATGKTRVLTAAAAERWLDRHRERVKAPSAAHKATRNLERDLDAALGIRERVPRASGGAR